MQDWEKVIAFHGHPCCLISSCLKGGCLDGVLVVYLVVPAPPDPPTPAT